MEHPHRFTTVERTLGWCPIGLLMPCKGMELVDFKKMKCND